MAPQSKQGGDCVAQSNDPTKEEVIRWFMERMDRVPDGAEMSVNIELAYFEESTWTYKDV
jgi:hypothetical protein